MINVKCSCSGYTLLEILAVVTIMGFSAALMASVFSDKADQKRVERTLQSIEEIKKAILGSTSERVRGDVRFAGYVQDMGDLPKLIDENGNEVKEGGEPRGLWTMDIDGDGNDDLPERNPYSPCDIACFSVGIAKSLEGGKVQAIFLGWNGPYLGPPKGRVPMDGWGNPFFFERTGDDFIIKSPGADGKQGGIGYDEDIVFIIKQNDWLAPLAGYMSPYIVHHSKEDIEMIGLISSPPADLTVKAYIYYGPKRGYQPEARSIFCGVGGSASAVVRDVTDKNATYQECVKVDDDGYFHFDGVPIGTERLLAITQPLKDDEIVLQPYKINIEPGINWLGNMGSVP